MKFLSRIFLNNETKQALAALDAICEELKNESNEASDGFDALVAVDTIYSKVHDVIKSSPDKVRASFLQNNETPEVFVWKILGGHSKEYITSGRNHFYRGVLNGRGQMYEKIFFKSLKKSAAAGKLSQEQISRITEEVKFQIADTG